MDIEKQKLILSCLCSSRDLMALCAPIIKPSYFDASLKKSVKFIKEYFSTYKDVPKIGVVKAECGISLDDVGQVTKAESTYISTEVEAFCRNKAVTEAILAGPELLEKQDFGKIIEQLKEAITIGLQKDLGMDYFNNPSERLKKTLEIQTRVSTGIKELDDAIGGGVARQELILFAANSGGGKSMTMLNLARNFLVKGLNGVYISLEMGEEVVSKRLDSMITGVKQDSLLKEMSKVANFIEQASSRMGKFIIKRMPENRTNINTIKSYLQQVEQATGFVPDFIVIDYVDIMGTTMNISMDNMFTKDKFVTEEIRSLGFDYNAIIVSASQLGRAALEADKLNQAHIQGGISKINTCDYAIGIKQDDLMRASGEIYLEILKSRNSSGVGTRILLGWDPISLRIFSHDKSEEKLVFNKKPEAKKVNTNGTIFSNNADDILNLMNT